MARSGELTLGNGPGLQGPAPDLPGGCLNAMQSGAL